MSLFPIRYSPLAAQFDFRVSSTFWIISATFSRAKRNLSIVFSRFPSSVGTHSDAPQTGPSQA